MDYSSLLRRAWDIVWNNKWLIVLGIIVSLTSGGSWGGGSNYSFGDGDFDREFQDGFEFEDGFEFDEEFNFERDFGAELPLIGGLAMALLIPLLCIGFAIGVVLWALGVVARGAIVAASDALDAGGTSSFSVAWRAAWEKAWRLIGISILPAIPTLILFVLAAGFGGALYGFNIVQGDIFAGTAGALGITFIALACIAGLAALVLGLLRTFAERAAMLEDTTVFQSYGRGWEVLSQNLGAAIVIFLIQIGIGIAIALLTLLLAPLLICLCLLIIPVSLIVNGTVAAYFSTLWTLAWRRWTGRAGVEPVVVEAPPAV